MESPELIQAAREVLLQGLGLLFELGDRTYSRSAGAPFHAAISSHYSQALDQFQSLVRGLRAGEIRYGFGDANPRLLAEVTYASVATCDVLRALKPYTEEMLSRGCLVIDGARSATAHLTSRVSSIGEELAHCAGQAIHHYGIIRLICQEFGISVPGEFGVLPSALRHYNLAAV
jgi:hypothetical protein